MLLALLLSTAQAKDLNNRVGVGVNLWFADIPTLSVRYGVPIANEANSLWNIQAEALIGYTTDIGTPNQFAGGGRLMTAVVVEDNLNVLAGAATGVLMSNSTAVLRMQPAVEIQAFPFGLNNLGITAGVGINLDLGGPETASELEGALLGGFHYWF